MFKLKLVSKPKMMKLKCKFSFPNIVLANLQKKEVVPSEEVQKIVADVPYDGLSEVVVDKIPDEYVIPSGTINIAQNGVYDVTDKVEANVNVQPKLQEKEKIIMENGTSVIEPDENFDGLSKVTINVDTPVVRLGTKTITENGVYKATDDNLDGYSEVNVETSGVDINEYFSDKISSGTSSFTEAGWVKTILKFRSPLTIEGTSGNFMFYYYPFEQLPELVGVENITMANEMFRESKIKTIPLYDFSNVTNMSNMFFQCRALTSISQIDTSKVTNMSNMFYNCTSLRTIPLLNTNNVRNVSSLFRGCSSLTELPKISLGAASSLYQFVYGCSSLKEFPQLDTSNISEFNGTFQYCNSLEKIPLLEMGKVNTFAYVFNNCSKLTNLGGFRNLGQSYSTSASENNSSLSINISSSTIVTHDSLVNIINELYDIKTKGVKPQQLILGSTNLAKLTSEEIAIATNKGWNVS